MSTTTNYNLTKPDTNTRVSDFVVNDAANLDVIDGALKSHADSIALLTPLKVTNASPVFSADSTYADYGYRGTITVQGATSSMRPEVIFGNDEALSGNYAAVCATGTDVVYIYAKVNTAITIPVVLVYKQ